MTIRNQTMCALLKRVIVGASLMTCSSAATDHPLPPSITQGTLQLTDYWVRGFSGGKNTAAYVTIVNTGEPDKLIEARCDQSTTVELHTHIDVDGVMKMRPVPSISIDKDPVVLKPGGMHIMLMGLKESFKEQTMITITLVFEKAGTIEVQFPVRKT